MHFIDTKRNKKRLFYGFTWIEKQESLLKSDKVVLSLARVRNVLMLVVEAFLESGRSGFRCQVKIQLRFSGLSFLGCAGLDCSFL